MDYLLFTYGVAHVLNGVILGEEAGRAIWDALLEKFFPRFMSDNKCTVIVDGVGFTWWDNALYVGKTIRIKDRVFNDVRYMHSTDTGTAYNEYLEEHQRGADWDYEACGTGDAGPDKEFMDNLEGLEAIYKAKAKDDEQYVKSLAWKPRNPV